MNMLPSPTLLFTSIVPLCFWTIPRLTDKPKPVPSPVSLVLKKGSKRPHNLHKAFTAEAEEKLKDLLHQSPRDYGKDSSLWTLGLLAKVCFEQGLTKKLVSDETIRMILRRLGIRWKRAKHWITSPDPHYEHKKSVKNI